MRFKYFQIHRTTTTLTTTTSKIPRRMNWNFFVAKEPSSATFIPMLRKCCTSTGSQAKTNRVLQVSSRRNTFALKPFINTGIALENASPSHPSSPTRGRSTSAKKRSSSVTLASKRACFR